MKIIENLPNEQPMADNIIKQTDDFFAGLSSELFEAVCRGLDVSLHPIALVTDQLMVVRQTDSCKNLLEDGGFYSIESALTPDECSVIKHCIDIKKEQILPLRIFDQPWDMHIIPVEGRALLIFHSPKQAGISMAVGHLRRSVEHLLTQASLMELDGSLKEDAAVIRQEALRILRQANHTEMLFGADIPVQWKQCSIIHVLTAAEKQLKQHEVKAEIQFPQDDVLFRGNEQLLLSALMTLVSNSLSHGGENVHIRLGGRREKEYVIFSVDDDGKGLSSEAYGNMNNAWRKIDTVPGGWGLGVPYARRIAELHGGSLIFAEQNKGCSVRLSVLALESESWELETENPYSLDAVSPVNSADVELSYVLGTQTFQRK